MKHVINHLTSKKAIPELAGFLDSLNQFSQNPDYLCLGPGQISTAFFDGPSLYPPTCDSQLPSSINNK